MQDFYDKIEAAIKNDKVWMPGKITENGEIRNILQVGVENKGAPKGAGIFLSRKRPSDFEEQDLGTFRHNEIKKTVDLRTKEIVSGSSQAGKKEGVVYMKRIGAWVPRYKIEQRKTNERFLRSLEIARLVNEKAQTRSADGALVKVGSGASKADSIVVGGSM